MGITEHRTKDGSKLFFLLGRTRSRYGYTRAGSQVRPLHGGFIALFECFSRYDDGNGMIWLGL